MFLMHTNPPIKTLADIGRKIFPVRLAVGLLAVLAGLATLHPVPFFGFGYRIVHALALALISAGLALRAWGAGSAGKHTRSGIIEATQLSTGGAFAYVRNPIYLGSIAIGFGMSALIGDPIAYILTCAAFGFLYFSIVPAEEEFLSREFGEQYRAYKLAVPRLLPRFNAFPDAHKCPFIWKAVRGELLVVLLLTGIYCALLCENYLRHTG
jgi:protein-S-isoprenylcysteine O-methyltransferase Ste14